MEDGPEEAESWYEYNGERYRLVEQDSEIWEVYGGGVYLSRCPSSRAGSLCSGAPPSEPGC